MLRSLAIAFSMYSKIPVPQFDWRERDMRYVMAFFPLVGLAIGLGQMLLLTLAFRLCLSRLPLALFMLLLPIGISGAIHLDGFMDTSDAIHSYRGREDKIRILKDPRTGAFAVISLVCLLLLALAAICIFLDPAHETGRFHVSALFFPRGNESVLEAMAGIFWLSRILSAFSVLTFPSMSGGGTLSAFAQTADRRKVLGLLILQLILVSFWILIQGRILGFFVLATGGASFLYYHWKSGREFGGINGDLAGWFVSYSEVAMALFAGLIKLLWDNLS